MEKKQNRNKKGNNMEFIIDRRDSETEEQFMERVENFCNRPSIEGWDFRVGENLEITQAKIITCARPVSNI